MYSPDKPFNDLPLLPPLVELDDVEILKKVNNANIALSRLNGALLALPNKMLLIQPLSVREAVASSGIENINTTVSEVFQAELFPIEYATKPQKETINYKTALLEGFSLVRENKFLATNSFIKIQSILEPDHPGIRKIPGTAIADGATGRVHYTPPDGENRIRDLLKNFEDYFNAFPAETDPLIRTAVLHYQFEAIHPFYDGNGRTGRMLIVLHLALANRLHLPVLFISGYLNTHRPDYYRLLNEVTSKSAWKSWILFILEAIESQARETDATIVKMLELREHLRERMKDIQPAMPVAEILEYLFSNPFYTRARISEKLKKHENSGLRYLNSLEKEGILDSFISKKEKVFYLKRLVDLL